MCKPPKNKIRSKFNIDPELKRQRDEALIKLNTAQNKALLVIDQMIEGWNGEGSADVKKKDMMTFPMMDWVELHKGCWIRRRLDVFGLVCFDTIIFEGVFFGNHFHSDADEICDIILGSLHDKLTGETFEKGKHSISLRNVFHHVGCVKGDRIPNLLARGLPFDECIGTELRVYFK